MKKNKDWIQAKDRLTASVEELGFPKDLGELFARQLGSPKAMDRMTGYLRQERPRKIEVAVDEMLAICSEIDAWRERKNAWESLTGYKEKH